MKHQQPQPPGGREKRRAPHLQCLIIAALALLGAAGFVTPARAGTGAGALARPTGSKSCTGGILNSQFWTVQAGDTITAQITKGAGEALKELKKTLQDRNDPETSAPS